MGSKAKEGDMSTTPISRRSRAQFTFYGIFGFVTTLYAHILLADTVGVSTWFSGVVAWALPSKAATHSLALGFVLRAWVYTEWQNNDRLTSTAVWRR